MRMRIKIACLFGATAAFAFLGFAMTPAQESDQEDVRGAFMTTRPKTTAKSSTGSTATRPKKKRPAPTPEPMDKQDKGSVGGAKAGDGSGRIRTSKIGLGLTLFSRDSNGLAVRVDPAKVFYSGDRVRALLETNVDGYLYIFNTTDGGKPVMIYPNPELDEGGNYIQSHIPFEIPDSVASQERLRWLAFDNNAGAERLFFVFARQPLPSVPIEDELISFCRDNAQSCPYQPSDELWTKIQNEMGGAVKIAKSKTYGKLQTKGEQEATTRGLGLSKEDPEPSMVMMASSPNTQMLVAMLELIHK